ncbi:MAG TPA: hypothetical protein VHP11_04870 [Tepidisphaeraceae bacterium]|nr:hypothetical protein [Tepidisphaeraceae bacterium]
MKRWSFNIAAATSLVLCVAAVVMWVRSCTLSDYLTHASVPDSWQLASQFRRDCWYNTGPSGGVAIGMEFSSSYGIFHLFFGHTMAPPQTLPSGFPRGWTLYSTPTPPTWKPPSDYWRHLGFSIRHWHQDGSGGVLQRNWFIGIPQGCIVLLSSLPPAVWILRYWRRQPKQLGLCPACGYDLRASRDRCPECGTSIPSAPYPEATS